MLPHHFASRRTRHVHGHVAAADHDHFLADSEFVAEIHVEQKIDAFVNAIEINSWNAEIAAAMRAHGHQHRIESLMAQVGDREVASGRLIELKSDVAGLENFPYLRFHHVTRQAGIRECRGKASRPPPAQLQKS